MIPLRPDPGVYSIGIALIAFAVFCGLFWAFVHLM